MSITIRTNINLTARLVISDKTLSEMKVQRAELRELAANRPEEMARMSAERHHLVNLMMADSTEEELIKTLFRAAFRDFAKDELCKELRQEGLKFDRVQAKVSYE